ncbi:Gfo/Idh/MocA family protein [Verrucomicrobiota bacterium]
MLRIGIIGAENSHCASIAKLCNVEKKVSARVVAVWGETRKFARTAAEAGQVPEIVKDWRELLGKVDGVMIDHRHPRYHAEPAEFFVGKGVPCFVDKPFTFTLSQGKKLCALARKKKVPITSFSTIPIQESFVEFKKATKKLGTVAHLNSFGPADLTSKYGGVFFYGIHQVDAIIELLGTEVDCVSLHRHGKGGLGVLTYRNGPVVTLHCVNNGSYAFHWSALGDKEVLDLTYASDQSPFLAGARTFLKMFRTGKEPLSHERMLAPVAVLEAMAKSLSLKGKPVKVRRVE